MVVIEREAVEITTFRIDGKYTDGRRPDSVSFTADIAEDLARRDFTINACAFSGDEIVDPYGGQDDLEKRLIRCVGDPERRFTEDALRILRGIRFASVLDFRIEESTRRAMFRCKDLLKNVSQERITAEFNKTLPGINVLGTLSEFRDILVYIIPEMKSLIGFEQHNRYHIYDVFEHTILSVKEIDNDIVLRTVMLFHDIGKPACFKLDGKGVGHFYGHNEISARMAEEILTRMRYPSDDIRSIVELIRYHDLEITLSHVGVKKALNKLGEAALRNLLKVKRADALAQNPAYLKKSLREIETVGKLLDEVIAENACITLHDLAITGNDLVAHGIPQGIVIGEILNRLLDLVLEEKLENKADILLEKAFALHNALKEKLVNEKFKNF
jgi:tRNA nucleotidyltransferase (CCA-adding enzyme)